jgi:hypothetical protein
MTAAASSMNYRQDFRSHGIAVTTITRCKVFKIMKGNNEEPPKMYAVMEVSAAASHDYINKDTQFILPRTLVMKDGEAEDDFLAFVEKNMTTYSKSARKALSKQIAKDVGDVVYATNNIGSIQEVSLFGWPRMMADQFIKRRFRKLLSGGTYDGSQRSVIASLRDRGDNSMAGTAKFRWRTLTGEIDFT